MKILFFSTVHPSPAAPTRGAFNHSLLMALRAEGHDVCAVVPVPWHESFKAPLGASEDTWYPRFWFPPRIARRWLHHFLRWSVRGTVEKIATTWRPEIVVGYWTHPDGTVALDIAHRWGVPCALMAGGTDINERASDPDRTKVITATLRRADRVFTIGEPLAARVAQLGVPREVITVHQRGVDRSRFNPGDRSESRRRLGLDPYRPILLWVGRMVPVKGLDTLLEAFGSLSTRPYPQLYLVGDGPERGRLARLAASWVDQPDMLHMTGPVAHAELADWYRAADLMVLPSRSEGVPNVLLEALACGTPFVASNVGGIPALAESPDWLVPPDDPAALALAIDRQLAAASRVQQLPVDDRGAARRFADALAETVANFDLRGQPRRLPLTPSDQRFAG